MIQRNILSLFVLASLLVSRECPGETGISLNTDAFNRAIEACNEAGGGRVVIPGGLWVTGPIRLLSHVNLHAEAGAVVLFTTDFDQYPYVRTYFEGQLDYRAMPLLFGDSIENIAITGEGIFDGSGQAWRPVIPGSAPVQGDPVGIARPGQIQGFLPSPAGSAGLL
jgi:polygalacturonase